MDIVFSGSDTPPLSYDEEELNEIVTDSNKGKTVQDYVNSTEPSWALRNVGHILENQYSMLNFVQLPSTLQKPNKQPHNNSQLHIVGRLPNIRAVFMLHNVGQVVMNK